MKEASYTNHNYNVLELARFPLAWNKLIFLKIRCYEGCNTGILGIQRILKNLKIFQKALSKW